MTGLEERVAVVEANYTHLEDAIESLTTSVTELKTSVDGFRGAIKMLLIMVPVAGTAGAFAWKYLI